MFNSDNVDPFEKTNNSLITTFGNLTSGSRFIFRNRIGSGGRFLLATRTVCYTGGKIEEKYAVDLFNGEILEQVRHDEIVLKTKNYD